MRVVIAVLIGAIIATGAAVVLVHNATIIRPASARVLYHHGSG